MYFPVLLLILHSMYVSVHVVHTVFTEVTGTEAGRDMFVEEQNEKLYMGVWIDRWYCASIEVKVDT